MKTVHVNVLLIVAVVVAVAVAVAVVAVAVAVAAVATVAMAMATTEAAQGLVAMVAPRTSTNVVMIAAVLNSQGENADGRAIRSGGNFCLVVSQSLRQGGYGIATTI